MHIVYKLVEGGLSYEANAYRNKLVDLSHYPHVGISRHEYQIQFINEYI